MPENKRKNASGRSKRLVFTHWDPTVYQNYTNINEFIIEIIWAALLYDRIYLRDVDLALNKHIAEMFLLEESRGILESLLERGFIRIHTMNPEWYPRKLKNSPLENPIAVRAEYVEKYSTYGTHKFKPSDVQQEFYQKLDSFLRVNRETAIECQPDYGIPKVFRKEFLEIIGNETNRNKLLEHSYYGGLTYRCLDAFTRYANEPEYAKSEILKSGQKVPEYPGEKLRFIRSLGYQCSSLLNTEHERKAIQKLLQSVFANVYCDSIEADGRYSFLLPEILINAEDNEQNDQSLLRIERVKKANINVNHKTFLEAIVDVRKNLPDLRNPIKSLQDISVIRNELNNVADVFAKHYGSKSPDSKLAINCETWLGSLGESVVAISILPIFKELRVAGVSINSLAKISSKFLKHITQQKYRKRISKELKRSMHARFVRVPLFTKRKTQ